MESRAMDAVERGEPAPRPAIDNSRRRLWTLPFPLLRKRAPQLQTVAPQLGPTVVVKRAGAWRRFRWWLWQRKAERRARRMREALRHTRVNLFLWRHRVTSIAEEDRSRLTVRFRRASYAQYRRRFVNNRLAAAFPAFCLLLWIAYYACLPIALRQKFAAGSYFYQAGVALIGSMLVFTGVLLIVSWIFSYLGLRQGGRIRRWLLNQGRNEAGRINRVRRGVRTGHWLESPFWAAIGWVVAILAFFNLARESGDLVFIVVLGLLGLPIVYVATVLLVWVALSLSRYSARRRQSDAAMAWELVHVLLSLELGAKRWPDLEFRIRITRHIAEASHIARSYLLQKFDVADPSTRLWRIRQASCIADALAQKQRWLMTPKPDTYDLLRETVARSVVAALSGAWDELAQADPEQPGGTQDPNQARLVSRARWAMALVLTGVRTMAVAALPAVVFWGARWRGLLITADPRVLDYVEIGVFVWAVFIPALALAPELREWISTFKEVTTILNPFAKREEK